MSSAMLLVSQAYLPGQKDIAGGGSILYAELKAMLHGDIDRDSDPSINCDIGDICFISRQLSQSYRSPRSLS